MHEGLADNDKVVGGGFEAINLLHRAAGASKSNKLISLSSKKRLPSMELDVSEATAASFEPCTYFAAPIVALVMIERRMRRMAQGGRRTRGGSFAS